MLDEATVKLVPSPTIFSPASPKITFLSFAKVTSPVVVKFPELSPSIHLTEPSVPSAIISCVSPVADPALILPIITFPEPDVILSPASLPNPIFELPVVTAVKAFAPIAVFELLF